MSNDPEGATLTNQESGPKPEVPPNVITGVFPEKLPQAAAQPERSKTEPQKLKFSDFKRGEGKFGIVMDEPDPQTHITKAQFLSGEGRISDRVDALALNLTPQELGYLRKMYLESYIKDGKIKHPAFFIPSEEDVMAWKQKGLIRAEIENVQDLKKLIITLDTSGIDIIPLGDLFGKEAGEKVKRLDWYLGQEGNQGKSIGILQSSGEKGLGEELTKQKGGDKVFILDTSNGPAEEESFPGAEKIVA